MTMKTFGYAHLENNIYISEYTSVVLREQLNLSVRLLAVLSSGWG